MSEIDPHILQAIAYDSLEQQASYTNSKEMSFGIASGKLAKRATLANLKQVQGEEASGLATETEEQPTASEYSYLDDDENQYLDVQDDSDSLSAETRVDVQSDGVGEEAEEYDMHEQDESDEFHELQNMQRFLEHSESQSLSPDKPQERQQSKRNSLLPDSPVVTVIDPDDIGKQYGRLHEQNVLQSVKMLPKQVEMLARKRGVTYTMMVVGESGVGKSTFIETLLGKDFFRLCADKSGVRSEADDVNILQSMSDDALASYQSISVHKGHFVERGFPVDLTVIETPGFGDYINNTDAYAAATKYIDEQLLLYMMQEEQPLRAKMFDSRVHACLYFLRPSGYQLSQLDIETMKALGERVSLIPVLAKADTYHPDTLQAVKAAVCRDIEANGICVYSPSDDRRGALHQSAGAPYAIVCATERHVNAAGEEVLGRKYPWGLAEVSKQQHSEFETLHSLLVREHMLELIDNTANTHYERFRSKMWRRRLAGLADGSETAGGTLVLLELSKTSRHEALQQQQIERDSVFLQRVEQLKQVSSKTIEFQRRKFQRWSQELAQRGAEWSREELAARKQIAQLQRAIEALSDAGTRARGSGRDARGAHESEGGAKQPAEDLRGPVLALDESADRAAEGFAKTSAGKARRRPLSRPAQAPVEQVHRQGQQAACPEVGAGAAGVAGVAAMGQAAAGGRDSSGAGEAAAVENSSRN